MCQGGAWEKVGPVRFSGKACWEKPMWWCSQPTVEAPAWVQNTRKSSRDVVMGQLWEVRTLQGTLDTDAENGDPSCPARKTWKTPVPWPVGSVPSRPSLSAASCSPVLPCLIWYSCSITLGSGGRPKGLLGARCEVALSESSKGPRLCDPGLCQWPQGRKQMVMLPMSAAPVVALAPNRAHL